MKEFINYKIIHYYPNKTALEFINIGVVAYSKDFFSFKFLDKEFEYFNCSFLNKKAVKGTIEYLQEKLINCKNINEFNQNTFYFDDFSFSKERLSKVYHNINSTIRDDYDKELDSIYEDYISYKFEKPIVIPDKRKEIKSLSEKIVKKEFKKYVKYNENEYFDFILDVKKNNNIKQYPTIIGSLFNSADTSRVFKLLVETDVEKGLFGYINSYEDITRHSEKAQKTLQILDMKLNFEAESFSNEESIVKSIEKLVA